MRGQNQIVTGSVHENHLNDLHLESTLIRVKGVSLRAGKRIHIVKHDRYLDQSN